ncbi:MAG: hypothetical protein LAT54_07240 [Cryomorphaceae bacterium]|nr:hypothetical protein [Cryomorphaceae bacterium]
MNTSIKFALILFCLTPALWAQWKVQEAGIRLEGIAETDNSVVAPDLATLPSIYPWSSIAQGDLSEYDKNYGYGNLTPRTHLFVGLTKEYWTYTTLRVGMFYGNAYTTTASYGRDVRQVIDTLRSSSSDRSVKIDSLNSRSINIDQHYQQLGVNAELLFHLNPEKRWTLYGGVGFMAGVHINNRIDITHRESIWEQINFGDQPTDQIYFGERSSRQWLGSSILDREQRAVDGLGYHLAASIPVGLDFTISKNEASTWNKVHLFWEWRPVFMYNNLSEGNDMFAVGIASAFGVRVHW